MNTPHAVRLDASPISVVAAQARVAAGETQSTNGDQSFDDEKALSAVARKGYDGSTADAKPSALPRRMWIIVAAGLVAWAVVAIPAFILFG